MDNTFVSKGQVMKVETLKLFEILKGEESKVFSPLAPREVTWMRESESRVILTYKGSLLQEIGSTTSDYYGYLDSVKSSIKEAKEYAKKLKIDPTHQLDVIVVTSIKDTPLEKVKTSDTKVTYYKNFKDNLFTENPKAFEKYLKDIKGKEFWWEENEALKKKAGFCAKTIVEDKEVWHFSKNQDVDDVINELKKLT